MAGTTRRRLVIVESPNKVKNIASYLGEGFTVEASSGHIRDLPNPSELPADMKKGPYGRFAVDVEKGFDPYYVVDADKKRRVAELKRALKESDELLLATDEDREGEAIAWHLLEVLKPKVPVKRMVFHEITKEAIQRALGETRDLDTRLVDAQETRRILDRLYGYEVSPVLWRKVRQGLSAGRVQSVVTRMIVERERERMAFVPAAYWDVEGTFATRGASAAGATEAFDARLNSLDGARVATGRDFDDRGALRTAKLVHLDEAAARAVAAAAQASTATVTDVAEKPYTRRPYAPFTTSTLQQEAGRKLRMTSRTCMSVAQRLYEGGYITYMRTDSTTLSESALTAARTQARDMYGAEYVPEKPRRYEKKVKNAQEAHEAIRPAGDRFRTPAQVAGELRGQEFELYELIWKRTVASQMADARGSTATVRLGVDLSGAPYDRAEFSASGTVITFRGFLAAYEEGRDEEESARAAARDEERRLPKVGVGVGLDVREVRADGHETAPPARYTEASMVAAMEEKGIGRPSTYAATIATIQDRGYVHKRGSALVPTWLAFAVTQLLEAHFSQLVDYEFTARMEEDLDEIARGDQGRVDWLTRFYYGDEATSAEGLRELVDDLGDIDAREISTIPLGDGMVVRVGRYGPYVEDTLAQGAPPPADPPNSQTLAQGAPPPADPPNSQTLAQGAPPPADPPNSQTLAQGAPPPPAPAALAAADQARSARDLPRRATITDDIAPDEMTPAKARELLEMASDDGRELGSNPDGGRTVVAKAGRYGPYVTELLTPAEEELKGKAKPKPRTASLFKSMDLATIDLATALRLLSLPRVVGTDAEGVEITAQNGRYGPYLKKGTDSRSLATEDQLFEITLDQALEIYAQPKQRGRAAAKPPLAQFEPDPVSGKPVQVKDGRFGPYVTDGETNATLRRDDDPATLTPERAYELLADKRAKGPTTRKRAAKSTAKKSTAKKTTAKKATAKMSTATTAAATPAATKAAAPKTAPRASAP